MLFQFKAYAAVAVFFVCTSSGIWPVRAQPLGIMSQKSQKAVARDVLSSQDGRYVFGQVSESDKDKFMLDTRTGRLWQIGESGKIGIHLKPVPYKGEGGKCTCVPGPVRAEKSEKDVKKEK